MKINRRKVKPARIEMLPLIDIVFLLLIFFIYAMLSMAVHRGLQLDIPESSVAEASPESPLSISIRKDGPGIRIFIDETEVSPAGLRSRLIGGHGKENTVVLIFADETISYQQLFGVLDLVREAGIERISLQADRE